MHSLPELVLVNSPAKTTFLRNRSLFKQEFNSFIFIHIISDQIKSLERLREPSFREQLLGLSSGIIILELGGIQRLRNIEGGQPQDGVGTLTEKSLCSVFPVIHEDPVAFLTLSEFVSSVNLIDVK